MAGDTSQRQSSLTRTIFITALIAGTLDIAAAIIQYLIIVRKNPVRIFYFIASGIFGGGAYNGNSLMIAWGILFHYTIAFIFTAFFFLIYPKIKILSRNIVLTGFAYGIFIWLIMNLVVLPLSHTPSLPFSLLQTISGILILMFAIGLPVAILTYRYYLRE